MKIIVFGSGGVGGYFGGRLAASGEDVVFVARGAHREAIATRGLKVDSILGDFVVHPAKVVEDVSVVGSADVILIAVKAWQIPDVAKLVSQVTKSETMVVPLSNGVEAPSQLSLVLGTEHVVGGLCRIISFIASAGHIRHVGAEPYVAFGELDGVKSPRVEKLRQIFEKAGVRVEVPDNIHVAMWEKFLFIASVSGLGAITRAPIGILRTIPETRTLLEKAMQEIFVVARARNIPLPDDSVSKTMNFVDSLPESSTASMQRDILEGRPSELSAQNGGIVRLGKEVGVETPVHEFVYDCLLPLEFRARGQIQFAAS